MNTGGDNTAAEEGDIILLEGMQGAEALGALIYYIMNTGVDNTAAEEGDIFFLEAAQGATQGPLQTAQAEIIAGKYHSFGNILYIIFS